MTTTQQVPQPNAPSRAPGLEVKDAASNASATDVLVTVCVVAYNSRRHLGRLVEAMARQTETRWRLVIVDNASAPEARPEPVSHPGVEIVQLEENTGYAAGNNLVGLSCTTPFFATLNPDAFPDASWLEALLDAASRHPGAAAFGSTQRSDKDHAVLDGTGDVYLFMGISYRSNHGKRAKPPQEGETFSACGAATLFRTADFQAAGGFEPGYFCYLEDLDLGFRLRLKNRRTIQASSAVVTHVGGASSSDSAFSQRLTARNRLWTFIRNVPSPWFEVLLPLHLAASTAIAFTHLARGRSASCAGLAEAIAGAGAQFMRRREIQAARSAKAHEIVAAFCWSPLAFFRRSPDVRKPQPQGK